MVKWGSGRTLSLIFLNTTFTWRPFWKMAAISFQQNIVRVVHLEVVQGGPPNTLIPNTCLQQPMSGESGLPPGYCVFCFHKKPPSPNVCNLSFSTCVSHDMWIKMIDIIANIKQIWYPLQSRKPWSWAWRRARVWWQSKMYPFYVSINADGWWMFIRYAVKMKQCIGNLLEVNVVSTFRRLRTRRVLTLCNNVSLRTRRALSP